MNATQIQKIENTFQDIMEKFDFEKVRALMLINGWKWAGEGVPSVGVMRETCCRLFKQMLEHPGYLGKGYYRGGTGGFQLKFWTWENGAMELELTFNWESVCYSVARD